jgi:hypothetical protein
MKSKHQSRKAIIGIGTPPPEYDTQAREKSSKPPNRTDN